jgi:hypothetical protein
MLNKTEPSWTNSLDFDCNSLPSKINTELRKEIRGTEENTVVLCSVPTNDPRA